MSSTPTRIVRASGAPARAVVIINPLSGHGRHRAQLTAHESLARSALQHHGITVEVRETTRAGDAHDFAAAAVSAGVDLAVAWGGDGTINEVASALVQTTTALGIVPSGSGNGLATDLGIPFEPGLALDTIAVGRTLQMDVGDVDGHPFFNIAGVGVDAVIAARFAERGMRKRGGLAYLQLSASELLRYQPQTYGVTVDEEHAEHRALLVAAANGRQYGNRLTIAPGARLDDGALEVVIVEAASLLSIVRRLPSVFRGNLRPGNGVSMRAARRLHITAEGPIPFHVDGEPRVATGALTITVKPGALRVRVPK